MRLTFPFAVFMILLCILMDTATAVALIGGRDGARDVLAAHVVMLVGTRGNVCSGVVMAPTVVLTAGHCVSGEGRYAVLLEPSAPSGPEDFIEVKRITMHPRFHPKAFVERRVSVDLAVVHLARALPASFRPAILEEEGSKIEVGERFAIFGFGLSVEGDENTLGQLRRLELAAAAPLSRVQLRLVGLSKLPQGSCRGDSGGPIFRLEGDTPKLVGIISWATGANGRTGCGGMTGGAVSIDHKDWIESTSTRE
jgi:secreted trypsin-like serine protease